MDLKSKSERNCHFCQEENGKRRIVSRELSEAWSKRKGRGGRKKLFSTEGYFCPNPCGDYYRITDGQRDCPKSRQIHKGTPTCRRDSNPAPNWWRLRKLPCDFSDSPNRST